MNYIKKIETVKEYNAQGQLVRETIAEYWNDIYSPNTWKVETLPLQQTAPVPPFSPFSITTSTIPI